MTLSDLEDAAQSHVMPLLEQKTNALVLVLGSLRCLGNRRADTHSLCGTEEERNQEDDRSSQLLSIVRSASFNPSR